MLAIGLVVDDAIIVVENVDRHIRHHQRSALEAALQGARELGGPIIAMTIVLIAAYVPIGFQGGLTGALFSEFAFTLAGAITLSGVVALTLSPMMASRLLRGGEIRVGWADRLFGWLHNGYRQRLQGTLETWSVMVVMGGLLLLGVVYLFITASSELAPEEDQGLVLGQVVGAPNATPQQMGGYAEQMYRLTRDLPEYDQMFQITGMPTVNQGIGGAVFIPWEQRQRSAAELQQELQQRWNSIAGAKVAAFQMPALPGAGGLPLQFVIKTTASFSQLNGVVEQVLERAQQSGTFATIEYRVVPESGGFIYTLLFALVIVFLALAVQFNSFRDPLVILVSVPMALFGALLFINLGLSTLNIYTQVGLVTLMGLISKHGILMVQFANELQRSGRSKLEAVVEASAVRLRPILMTTAATVLGVLPLVLASGAGAAGRFSMGLVIFTGLAVGTLFTLFVVPAVYLLLGKERNRGLSSDSALI